MARQLLPADELTNSFIDERVKILIPQFEALAPYKITDRKKGKDGLTGWEQLASREVRLLKTTYPDDKPEGEKTYSSAYRQSQALKKSLKAVTADKLKDPMVINQFQTIVKNFSLAVTFLFSEYKAKQNEKDDQKVTERRKPENRVILDLTNSLKYAYNILTDIKNGEDDTNWLDVSCAVALATGRRMGEVHLSASFEKIDDYKIIFKGQLKGKERKVKMIDKAVKLIDVPFPIPVILPADLVIYALDWLGKKDKRFDRKEDPERVNRRFSKTLNQACKDWDIFPEDERTYHKFRAAYLRACIINDGNVDPYDFTDFAKKILCDNDEATINAYKRYEIKEGSLTRI
ncbi:protelomerase family protein [Dolichospermum sp. UHCC 0259]|uniref:protelomerase family protein n=1 Tax=Dolichospermum sp. UHCC 0259 TaxID=2590010 RepID=UPI00144881B2|nr:protelomerase family protein [Dolichospermum sp. UHCC 0259]MTJ47622.1 hypothetical protein [Dolichospermum sp. UHCC 0259]